MDKSLSETPQALAAFVQVLLQTIENKSAGLASRVRAEMDPAVLKDIETASRISWLPLGHHVALTECTYHEGSRGQGSEICRQAVLESFAQPFLSPIIRGALTVLGPSMADFSRWTPKAWVALFRGVGELAWVPGGAGASTLLLAPAHPQILRSPDYIEGIAGSFSALFEITHTTGTIRARADDSRVIFDLTWTSQS